MSLIHRAVRGAAWNVATSLVARVVSVIATLVITRYLSPDEYGEALGSILLVQVCLTLSQMGLPQYLLARPDSGPRVVFHIAFYTNLACVVALAVVHLIRARVGPFFSLHELGRYLPWLTVTTFGESLAVVPERLLYRDLRFRVVALARAAADLGFSVTALALARAGQGGMALVYGGLLRVLLRLLVYSLQIDWRASIRPCALRWSTTREIFRFGLPLSVSVVAGSLSVRWDNMVTSRYFGAATMGVYNLAYSLSEVPVVNVGEQIGDVLLPSFARLPPDARRAALSRSMALIGLIVFPLAVGLAAVSPTLVEALFDPKWSRVAPMLSVLAVIAVTRPISYLVISYLQVSARVVVVSVLEVTKVAILFTLMTLAAPSGMMAVCAAVGTAFLYHALVGLFVVTRDGLPFWGTLLRVGRPLLSTAPMAAAVFGARWALAAAGLRAPWIRVVVEISGGAVVYVGAASLLAGDTARELISLTRAAARRQRGAD